MLAEYFMRKVNPHFKEGVDFIQVSRLPFNQAKDIRDSFLSSNVTGVETAVGFVPDAIEYSQYEYWFDFEYKSDDRKFDF